MRKHFTKSTTLNFIVVISKRLLLTNNEIQSRQGNGLIPEPK